MESEWDPEIPELMTLKAVRLIKECDFCRCAQIGREGEGVATDCPSGSRGEIFRQKQLVEVAMPMTATRSCWRKATNRQPSRLRRCWMGTRRWSFFDTGGPCHLFYLYICTQTGAAARLCGGDGAGRAFLLRSCCQAQHQPCRRRATAARHPRLLSGRVEEGLEWAGPKVLMKTGRSMKRSSTCCNSAVRWTRRR